MRRWRHQRSEGFALVVVIWTLGLISLLCVSAIVGARYRARSMSGVSAVARLSAAAESGIILGLAAARQPDPADAPRRSWECRLPGGESLSILMEDEAGKVDLNMASAALLAKMFSGLTGNQVEGKHLADAILTFRSGRRVDNAPQSTAAPSRDQAPVFVSILQLEQVDGISPRIFRAALPFITVRSGRSEPIASAANPMLRKLLGLDLNSQPMPASPSNVDRAVTIRVDARGPNDGRLIREAVASTGQGGGSYRVREWRLGRISPAYAETHSPEKRLSDCFSLAERSLPR